MKSKDQRRVDQNRRSYTVSFPDELEDKHVVEVVRSLREDPRVRRFNFWGTPTFAHELWRDVKGVTYRLRAPAQDDDYIEGQLMGLTPGVIATPEEDAPLHLWQAMAELGLKDSTRTLGVPDPTNLAHAIIGATSAVRPEDGEAIIIQLVGMADRTRQKPKPEKTSRTSHFGLGLVLSAAQPDKDLLADQTAKLKEPNILCVLRIGTRAATNERAEQLLTVIRRAITSRTTGLVQRRVGAAKLRQAIEDATGHGVWPMRLNVPEFAALMAWPIGSPNDHELPQTRGVFLRATAEVPSTGIVVADSNVRGRGRPIALTKRGITMSVYASAPPGGGKSVFLANGFAQVVADPFNCGAFVLETSGKPDDLMHRCLEYIPKERVDRGDVAIIDVMDSEWPVGFNLLEQGNPQTVADNLQSLFDAIYGNTAIVTMPRALYHAVMVLMTTTAAARKMAFTDLALFFEPMTKAQYDLGKHMALHVPDRKLRETWKAIYEDNPTPAKMRTTFKVMALRIWQLNSRPEVRNIFGQSKSTFSMYDAIKNNQIVMANLAGLGETVKNIVGAILIDAMWGGIKGGAANQDRPFCCFIDEFQNYPNLARDADVMLAEGRGWGLSMWLANQGMHQLSVPLQQTVRLNIRNRFVFQTNSYNAKVFAEDFGGQVTPEQLKQLGPYEAVARVVGETPDGRMVVTPPFSATMRPPLAGNGLGERARAISRNKYGRPRAEVEREIDSCWFIEDEDGKPKRGPLGKPAG